MIWRVLSWGPQSCLIASTYWDAVFMGGSHAFRLCPTVCLSVCGKYSMWKSCDFEGVGLGLSDPLGSGHTAKRQNLEVEY